MKKKMYSDKKKGETAKPSSKTPGAKTKVSSDWRADLLDQVRTLIQKTAPEAIEEIKWRKPSNPAGVPVWSHGGILFTGETYKDKVKLTFAKGASLEDSARLFNSSLDGNARRAIDFHEGDKINEKALKALILAAVALNTAAKAPARPAPRKSSKVRKNR